jgi:hypothetical protein
VRAGALPLPIMQLADELATACKKLKLPVRWMQQNSTPIAIVNITNNASTENRHFFVDSIELRNNEMYVAGHTDDSNGERKSLQISKSKDARDKNISLDDYELRLTPSDEHAALEIARRQSAAAVIDDATKN